MLWIVVQNLDRDMRTKPMRSSTGPWVSGDAFFDRERQHRRAGGRTFPHRWRGAQGVLAASVQRAAQMEDVARALVAAAGRVPNAVQRLIPAIAGLTAIRPAGRNGAVRRPGNRHPAIARHARREELDQAASTSGILGAALAHDATLRTPVLIACAAASIRPPDASTPALCALRSTPVQTYS